MNTADSFTVLHLSDIHAGPPAFQPHIADRVVEDAQRLQPTLTVISGDLVYREWASHFAQAHEFVQRLPRPRLIIPGNHDIPAFHVWEALFNPLGRFRRYISDEDPFFHIPGLAVLGLNSTLPFLASGLIGRAQLRRVAEKLTGLPADTCRVVTVHHHFVPPPRQASLISSQVWAARRALDAFERAGVELVLSGHMHRSFIGNSLDFRQRARRGAILVQAGTATSRRGRLSERFKNTYNLIYIDSAHIVITHFMYFAELGKFAPLSRHIFPRGPKSVAAQLYSIQNSFRVNAPLFQGGYSASYATAVHYPVCWPGSIPLWRVIWFGTSYRDLVTTVHQGRAYDSGSYAPRCCGAEAMNHLPM